MANGTWRMMNERKNVHLHSLKQIANFYGNVADESITKRKNKLFIFRVLFGAINIHIPPLFLVVHCEQSKNGDDINIWMYSGSYFIFNCIMMHVRKLNRQEQKQQKPGMKFASLYPIIVCYHSFCLASLFDLDFSVRLLFVSFTRNRVVQITTRISKHMKRTNQ